MAPREHVVLAEIHKRVPKAHPLAGELPLKRRIRVGAVGFDELKHIGRVLFAGRHN